MIWLKIEFKIRRNHRGHVLVRAGGEYSQHAHLKQIETCRTVIKLIEQNKLPRSKYLQGACKRLLTEQEYALLKPCKQQYFNVNKGGCKSC